MEALPNYWLNRLGIDDNEQRELFVTLMNDAFKTLDNGDTVFQSQSNSTLILDSHLAVSIKQATEHHFAPLVIDQDYAWLYRSWRAEYQLAQLICARLVTSSQLNSGYPEYNLVGLRQEQQDAVQHALEHSLSIINGGPGTGKTFTVARLVQLLHSTNPKLSIALAAPTGKAAKRMEESLRTALSHDAESQFLPPAQTLHRLLGIGVDGIPKYNSKHYLAHDVVIIDEASMLSLEMAHALFAAVNPDAKLILLGDANQLAAVDPGAILHDLSRHTKVKTALTTLKETARFDQQSGIGKLATGLQKNEISSDGGSISKLLSNSQDIYWQSSFDAQTYQTLFDPYKDYLLKLQDTQTEARELMNTFNQYRILCAGHHGLLGTKEINKVMLKKHQLAQDEPIGHAAFHGMPIMVTANDYQLGIFNGDIGLCLRYGDELYVHFSGSSSPIPLIQISPTKWSLAYALTVHKSQGSEYKHVALALDQSAHSITRELLYTGVTRAKSQLSIFADETTLIAAVNHPTKRSTGLEWLINKEMPA